MIRETIHRILLVLCFLLAQSVYGYTDGQHEDHAYHIFTKEIFISPSPIAGGYRYEVNPSDLVDSDIVIDEIYIRLDFIDEQYNDVSNFLGAACGTNTFVPQDFESMEQGVSLILDNSFIDAPGGNTVENLWQACTDSWTIDVLGVEAGTGDETVNKITLYVTYHRKLDGAVTIANSAMPDYFSVNPYISGGAIAGGGKSNLHIIDTASIQLETACTQVDSGTKVDATNTKLMVIVHGWNSNENLNNFAPSDEPDQDPTCPSRASAFYDESTSDSEGNRNRFKWERLIEKFNENPISAEDWALARYDWSGDASTGPTFNFADSSVLTNADASRDAAHIHGLRLGQSIEALGLEKVYFIAHSAGSWAVRRAALYLRINSPSLEIQITVLDPFVNNEDGTGLNDIDLLPLMEMTSQWVDKAENYWVFDGLSSDLLGYTSGAFSGWSKNINIGVLSAFDDDLFIDFMDNHGGPVYWYANSLDVTYAGTPAGQNTVYDDYNLGNYSSIAWDEIEISPAVSSVSQTQSIGTNIDIQFSKTMDVTTLINANIMLSGSTSGVGLAKILSYNASTKTLTINPDEAFNYAETVTVTLSSAIKDAYENNLSGGFSTQFAVEQAASGELTVISSLPANGMSGVNPLDEIFLVFSHNVEISSVQAALNIVGSQSGAVGATFTPSSGNSSTVKISPLQAFATNETINLSLDGTVQRPTDETLDGNYDGSATGVGDIYTLGFTTNTDISTITLPPRIISIHPGDGVTGIRPDSEITLKFSEPINTATINGSSVSIFGSSSNSHSFTVTDVFGDGLVFALNPNTDFTLGEQVTVSISNTVLSQSGDPIVTGETVYFDVRTLVISSVLPNTFTGGVISTNEKMTSANSPYVISSNITVSAGATLEIEAGTIIKFSPPPFSYNERYRMIVNGTLDAQGDVGNPITFTSYKDDDVGGDTNGNGASVGSTLDWWGIDFNGVGSTDSIVSNVDFRYGGYSDDTGEDAFIYISNSDPIILSSSFYSAYETAIETVNSRVRINFNTFDLIVGDGIKNNTSAILLDGRYNFWNSIDGPSGFGSGSGVAVSAYVDYAPWLNAPAEFSGDSDMDGMSDAYELFYGLDPDNNADALSDNDNDGFTAFQEHQAGTDPTVNSSSPNPPLITFNGGSAVEGNSVGLSATASSSYGSIVSYLWNFDDGQNGSGQAINHTYVSDGSYFVGITVVDDLGISNTVYAPVVISDTAPTAQFTLDPPLNFATGLEITGSDTSTAYDGVTGWSWDMGDGTTYTTQNIQHTYATAGDFTITFTAIDSDGSTDQTLQQIDVTELPNEVNVPLPLWMLFALATLMAYGARLSYRHKS